MEVFRQFGGTYQELRSAVWSTHAALCPTVKRARLAEAPAIAASLVHISGRHTLEMTSARGRSADDLRAALVCLVVDTLRQTTAPPQPQVSDSEEEEEEDGEPVSDEEFGEEIQEADEEDNAPMHQDESGAPMPEEGSEGEGSETAMHQEGSGGEDSETAMPGEGSGGEGSDTETEEEARIYPEQAQQAVPAEAARCHLTPAESLLDYAASVQPSINACAAGTATN